MVTRDEVTSLIGKQVSCHTHFGVFHGVIVHCTEQHIILAPMLVPYNPSGHAPHHAHAHRTDEAEARWGPGGYGPGPGGPPGGPGGGGGWHIAVPLAAIIGVTAIGLHWF